MKALCWCSKGKVQIENVADPKIINTHDAIIKVTSTAICGSDLHLLNGCVPDMHRGDILGHEFMGEVVEAASENKKLKVGDRIVVPFTIACGKCAYCMKGEWANCDNTNPDVWKAEELYGYSGCGMFGFSHLFGGYAGGQAEYVRVPFADVGPIKIPDGIPDEQVLFLSDILPTAYMAAENCGLKGGETVAVWGCGPVGQLAIQCAYLLGASRVIAIDRVKARLEMAVDKGKAESINSDDQNVPETLKFMTGGRGPDACIDAVGLEAHGMSQDNIYDHVKTAMFLETDRAHVLREAIYCCGKGGTVSVPGVYAGWIDKFPFGAAFGKGLTIKCGQTHVQRYLKPLLERIQRSEIDTTYIISHRLRLGDAPYAYKNFNSSKDTYTKVVMKP